MKMRKSVCVCGVCVCVCVCVCFPSPFLSLNHIQYPLRTFLSIKICWEAEMTYQIRGQCLQSLQTCQLLSFLSVPWHWRTTVFTPCILYVSYQWASKKYLCSPLFTTLRFPEVLFQLLALPGIVLQSQKGKGTVMTTSCWKVMAFRGFAVYKVSWNCASFQYGVWKIIGSLPKVRSTSSFSSYHWTASEYRSQKGSWRFCSNTLILQMKNQDSGRQG